MRRVLVDTSALMAFLVPTDASHRKARRAFERLRAADAALVATSYVLVETYSLLGRRYGLDAARSFRERFEPLLDVVWVDRDLHERGLDLLLGRSDGSLSLVDAVSFLVVREARIDRVFAFDRHFKREGFESV